MLMIIIYIHKKGCLQAPGTCLTSLGMGDELGYEELGGGRPRDGRRGPKRPRHGQKK